MSAATKDHAKRKPRYMADPGAFFSAEQTERTRKRSREMEKKVRTRLSSAKGRAKAMAYFDELMRYDGVRAVELKEFREKGGKVVGTLCVMVPLELIEASGAKHVRLCSGYYEPVHPANELLGDAGLCPLVKSTLGSKMVSSDPLVNMVDLVAGPATCDGKMKLAEMLEDWVPVVMMNTPRVKLGETSTELWLKEVLHLKRKLSELTGRKVTKKALVERIRKWNEASELWNKVCDLRKGGDPPISGQDAMLVVQASQSDDIDRWVVKVKALLKELEEKKKSGGSSAEKGAARVLLMGSPIIYPNFKIPSLIEESGGSIVTDELCTGYRLMADPVVLDGLSEREVYSALADRYYFPCSCPCFSPNDERVTRLLGAIDTFGIEGVVFHTLRGCHLNNLEATKIELALRVRGIPMVKLESEYDEGDVEQVRTRVEAFVEMLKARRKK